MENTSNEQKVVTEVETTPNAQPFRTFETQQDFDNFAAHLIKKAEDKAFKNAKVDENGAVFNAEQYQKQFEAKFRKDLEATIKADLEKKAKMSEAEKLSEERRLMEESFRTEKIEINRDKASVLLASAGFTEEEMDVYLDFVNEDREISLGKIRRVCETRKASQEKLKSDWQAELQKSNPSIAIGSNNSITPEEAAKMTIAERTKLKLENYPLYQSLFKK